MVPNSWTFGDELKGFGDGRSLQRSLVNYGTRGYRDSNDSSVPNSQQGGWINNQGSYAYQGWVDPSSSKSGFHEADNHYGYSQSNQPCGFYQSRSESDWTFEPETETWREPSSTHSTTKASPLTSSTAFSTSPTSTTSYPELSTRSLDEQARNRVAVQKYQRKKKQESQTAITELEELKKKNSQLKEENGRKRNCLEQLLDKFK